MRRSCRAAATACLWLGLLSCTTAAGAPGAPAAPSLVFEHVGQVETSLWLVAADGRSKPRLLFNGYSDPAWSPDGHRLVLASSYGTEDCSVPYITVLFVLVPGQPVPQQLTDAPLDNPCASYFAPAWSPDGRLVACRYTKDSRPANPVWRVAVVRSSAPEGSVEPVVVTKEPGDRPSWSPRSDKVAYQSSAGISVLDVKARVSRLLARGGADPAWSPSGKKIAFSSPRGLEVIRTDGSGRKLLVRLSDAREIAWSPRGRTIAFAAGHPSRIYEANPDGTGFRPMTSPSLDAQTPDWSPDGKELAVSAQEGGQPGIWTLRSSGGGFIHLSTSKDDRLPRWRPR